MNHHPHRWAPRGAVVCSRPHSRVRSEIVKLLTGCTLLGVAAAHAQTPVVEQVNVTKGASWRQMTAGDPILEPRNAGVGYGGPFNFLVHVEGTDLATITPPVITLAPGSLYPTQNPSRHNGGVLAYSASQETWNYGADTGQWGGQTAAERDASFAAGTYGFNVLGESFSLSLPATAFPSTPAKFTLTGGTWVGGKYVVDPTQVVTITTNAFPNFTQNADGVMSLWVNDTPVETVVFRSDSPAAPNFLTATIPANTLTPGVDYRVGAQNYAVTDKRGTSGTRYDAAAYESFTTMTIAAMPPSSPTAQGTLYGVGELDGGSDYSEVRDATKVGGVIYAVGDGISNNGSSGADTAFVWSSTDGLRPLPDITPNFSSALSIQAPAITPDAAYIASRARAAANGSQRHAVRVTRSSLANSDLGVLSGFNYSQANTISSDGSVLYGVATYTSSASVPVKNRTVRFAGGSITTIPFLSGTDDNSAPADRGASADGNVVVGRSTNGTTDAADGLNGIGPGNRAFRYVHSTATIAEIPLLPGGTWNGGVAVSPDGNLVLTRGDSTTAPQGEFALYNVTTSTLTALGSPNGSRRPSGIVGMTSDGSVVATPFNPADNTTTSTYIRNAHGWHDFESIVAAAGINTTGWRLNEGIFGMSPDGTLVWGRAVHDGVREGFIVEFAPGFLAAYQEPAVNGTPDSAIIGAWAIGDGSDPEDEVIVFAADGYYTHIGRKNDSDSADGFERGRYTWNAATGAFTCTTLRDLDGDHGLGASNDVAGLTISITGDTLTFTHPGDDPAVLTRVAGASPIIGAFGFTRETNDFAVGVFLPSGYYFLATAVDPSDNPLDSDGIDWGTYTWDPVTGQVTVTPLLDTNGGAGFEPTTLADQTYFSFSGDLLELRSFGPNDHFSVTRIGLPGTPGTMPAISAQPTDQSTNATGSASFTVGATGSALTYQWYRSGVALPGATSATLAISPASRTDADTYTVQVNSGYRYVVSNAVRLTVAPSPYAQGLQLDAAFTPAIDATGSQATTNKIVLLPDGKFIVAGYFHTVAGAPRNRVARFNSDGTLDATFAPVAVGPLPLLVAAVQADGKVLIGGPDSAVLGHARRLVRLNTDGSVDPAFNTGSGFAGGNVNALLVQPDGRILVAGAFTSFNGAACNRLARLNSDGTLDAGFSASADGAVNALALTATGKILVGGGFTNVNSSPRNRLTQLNADGTLDAGFSIGTGANNTVLAIEVATDGTNNVLIGGAFTTYAGTTANRIARLTSAGAFDATFATGTGFNNNVNALAPQPDGKVLAAGTFTTFNGPTANRLVRLGSTGAVDATFSIGTGLNGAAFTLALHGDGRVLVGGGFSAINGTNRNATFARLSPTGVVDAAVNPTLVCSAAPAVMARQPGGKLLVGGNFTRVNGGTRFNLARFNADGSFDAAYNPGATSGTSINGIVLGLTVRADGKTIIVGGFTSVMGTPMNRLARLNADGTLDPTFAIGGGLTNSHSLIVQQPDGKLLIGGNNTATVIFDGDVYSGLVRLWPDGQLDEDFNPGTLFNGSVEAAVVQPDGRIVVAGNFTTVNGIAHSNIARLNADGSLDPSFTTLAFNNSVTALALQPTGEIIAGGAFTTYNGATRNRLIRFTSTGAVDGTFNIGTGANSNLSGVLLQEDGRILVRGPFSSFNGAANSASVVRLSSTGAVDSTFKLFGPTLSGATVSSLLVNDDGTLLTLGAVFYDPLVVRPAIAHYLPATAASIASDPTSLTVNQGEFASFSVGASGTAPITYQWRKNGVNIPGAIAATLPIWSAQPSDAGSYDAVVTNYGGSATSTAATLTVRIPPSISLQPTDQSVNVGTPVTFNANATGDPSPTFQWRKDGVNIPGATGVSYTIPSSTTAHAGNYTFVATNAAASTVSNVAVLTVKETFAEWGASSGLVGPAASLTADPDGDGLTNLMEYALGLSPTNTGGPGALPTMVKLPDTDVEFSFTRPSSATGLTYSIETRPSLSTGTWTPVPFAIVNIGGGREAMKIELPTGTSGGFVRLVVTKTP